MTVQRWLFVVTRYLTYTFGPISIAFIQPFLDDTSRTLRQFSGQKSQLERWPNFPRGGPGMLELCNVFWNWGPAKKVWKVFWTPHYCKNNFWNVFPPKRSPHPPPPFPPFTFYCQIFGYQKTFWGDPRKGRGPNFLSSPSTHPPSRYRLARPGSNIYL
jgi:hypothetical protein